MATYYEGSGEIQGQGGENLQTLYLMNPNYFATTPYSETNHNYNHNHNHNHQILLNTTITPTTLNQGIASQALPHQQQQLIGIPLPGPNHSNDLGRPSHHHQNLAVSGAGQYSNNSLWSPIEESPANPGPAQGGLSLSLNRGGMAGEDARMSVTVASGPGSGNGVVIGSKYLRATQELLEEVVNVGGIQIGESSGVHKANKAKAVVKGGGDDEVAGVGQGGGGGETSKKGDELNTARRHELQMKKAKLLNMIDEVEQRYRQYQTQMEVIVASFEQAAGIGSAKSYTSLALKTISKQFKCLKDAIGSQIKATSRSLGEDDSNGGVKLEGRVGSRLRYVDNQLRQQRALQQLGMMQQNAWRPQRGLPERAVSVLRAWLFEHFLHPYPKDSDKHMLAKQTGLTRSQVSNWFINARVRLWKPMVEEMYVEEMKSQEQNCVASEDNTTSTTKNGGIGRPSSKNEQIQDPNSMTNKTIQQEEEEEEEEEENGGFNNIIQTTTNDMISTLSTTTSQGFTLIGSSSDMESLMARSSVKKQRSNSDMNNSSPSSILSTDMEMKPIDQHHQKYGQDLLQRQHSSILSTHGGAGFNPYILNNNNDIGRFNPTSYHGNAVSLTLGLPHCHENSTTTTNNNNNMSISQHHQQDLFPNNHGMQLGRLVDIGWDENDNYCGIRMGQPSHTTSNVYQSLDIQSRKRFAAHQILHDFVA